jgi:hypothetical protein
MMKKDNSTTIMMRVAIHPDIVYQLNNFSAVGDPVPTCGRNRKIKPTIGPIADATV